jgi:hypothetical protein
MAHEWGFCVECDAWFLCDTAAEEANRCTTCGVPTRLTVPELLLDRLAGAGD